MNSINKDQFIERMLELLPESYADFKENVEYNGEVLYTVVIESVFMEMIFKLLKENKEERLIKIFKYFDEVCVHGDKELKGPIFGIAVLEKIALTPDMLALAKKYMGFETIKIHNEEWPHLSIDK